MSENKKGINPNINMQQGEIVIYQPKNTDNFQLEVRVDEESVWLNRNQLALLFGRDVKTIGKHINNALKEELCDIQVVAKFATTAADGKIYQVENYNLDVIISVGYRVKSQRGIDFRIWSTKILKDYLLKGYAIQHRFEKIEEDINTLKFKVTDIDFQIKTNLPPNEGVFFDGQVFDAYQFVAKLIKSAQQTIVLLDNYIDESVLLVLSKRNPGVKAVIYTAELNKQQQLDRMKFNQQYPEITIKQFLKSHDRFLIIDNKTVYHIGASLKDLGKKWFAFSVINLDVNEMLLKLNSNQ